MKIFSKELLYKKNNASSNINWFAWKSTNLSPEKVVYTLTETPVANVDFVYSSPNELLYEIKNVSGSTITAGNNLYSWGSSFYTLSPTPAVNDWIYDANGNILQTSVFSMYVTSYTASSNRINITGKKTSSGGGLIGSPPYMYAIRTPENDLFEGTFTRYPELDDATPILI